MNAHPSLSSSEKSSSKVPKMSGNGSVAAAAVGGSVDTNVAAMARDYGVEIQVGAAVGIGIRASTAFTTATKRPRAIATA